MRLIELTYKAYIDGLKEKGSDIKVKITQKDRDILRNIKREESVQTADSEIKIGDVYFLNDIYFAVADMKKPYEAYLLTPYPELISNEDLTISIDNNIFGLLSLVRYVSDDILKKSIKIGNIRKDIKLMKYYMEKGKPLPKDRAGLSYPEGQGYYQELFRKNEAERSLFLNADVLAFDDGDSICLVINLSNNIKNKILAAAASKLAAAASDRLRETSFGYISAEKNGICIYFEDIYQGKSAKLYYQSDIVYEGILPEKLIINRLDDVHILDELKQGLKVEIL